MKAIIYLFTGTGNTLKVAKLYQEYLKNYEVEIYRISVRSEGFPDPNNYDLVGFGYPIHAFAAPEPFIKFIKKLPKVIDKKTFIFKTAGEGLHLNDGSSIQAIKILRKKGFKIVQERHLIMPYNILYRHKDGMAKQMWVYAKALVHLNCQDILENRNDSLKVRWTRKWFVPFVRMIEWTGAKIHGPLFKVNKKKCLNCDKCLRECPTGNIVKDSRKGYKFKHQCCLCMSCAFYCPRNALKIGLLNHWKVNGDYQMEELARKKEIEFPYINGREKGVYKMYRKYYKACDKKLMAANISIKDYLE